MNYNEILRKLRTNKDWQVNGETYDSIVWRDKTCEIPTEEECINTWNEIKPEIQLSLIREKRNTLLMNTDKYTIADWPHPSPEAKQAWLDYRQALRDLPSNTTDPENPVWPDAPN
jgi:hypothetical protein